MKIVRPMKNETSNVTFVSADKIPLGNLDKYILEFKKYIYIYMSCLIWFNQMSYQLLKFIQCQILFPHIYLIYTICKNIC